MTGTRHTAATAALIGAVAAGGTFLLLGAVPTDPVTPPVAVAAVTAAPEIDIPAPDSPADLLIADLVGEPSPAVEPASPPLRFTLFEADGRTASAFVLRSGADNGPPAFRLGFAEAEATPSSPPEPPAGTVSAPAAAEKVRLMLRREADEHDPALTRLAVLPPPRPASVALTALAPAAPEAPLPEPALPPVPSWSWGLPDRPDTGIDGRSIGAGIASWYGPRFHGRRTASGEIFNQHALTAAHRHLPFGTRVRVVDPASGRSVVVRINDRGPFGHGRVIDLSRASAEALGVRGLTRVKLVSAE